MKKTIEELLAEMQPFADAAEERNLTDEELTQYRSLKDELERTRQSEEVRSLQKAYTAPNASLRTAVNVGTVKETDDEMRAFDHYLRSGVPNQDISHLETRAQSTSDSAGGYTVPTTLLNRITERMKAFGGVANEAETITTEMGNPITWPSVDDTGNSGVVAAEGAAPGSGGADIVFGEITLGAHRYVAPGAGNNPLLVSKELLQDSAFDIQSFVIDHLATRIARAQAAHFVNGTGTGQPTGIATSTTVQTTFAGASIDKDDLISAIHDVDPEYRTNAVWIFNDSTLEAIRKLEDSQGRPLWLPQAQSGLETSIGGTLFGHRVVIDQAFANYSDASSNNFGVFGDIRRGYLIRRVQSVQVLVNPYTTMGTGQVGYWLDARADGTPNDRYAYTVLQNDAA